MRKDVEIEGDMSQKTEPLGEERAIEGRAACSHVVCILLEGRTGPQCTTNFPVQVDTVGIQRNARLRFPIQRRLAMFSEESSQRRHASTE